MRVVLDTNVLVAAARSRNGASHALLSRLPDERFTPAVSVPLFLEYRAVLLRAENLLGRTAMQAEGFLDFFLAASHLQEIFYTWRPVLSDPGDDMLLELAVAAGAKKVNARIMLLSWRARRTCHRCWGTQSKTGFESSPNAASVAG